MPDQTETIISTDLTRSLISDIVQTLHWYSTALIKATIDKTGQEKVSLIGSGTFVTIGSISGILTAQHVSRLLSESCSLGLAIRTTEHKYMIDHQYLRIIEVAKAVVPSEGPDLSFIKLQPSDVATIRASEKSFYNISRKREEVLNDPLDLDMGIWLICGVPEEQITDEESGRGFDALKGFHALCGVGPVSRGFDFGKFDYFEVDVHYGQDNNVPLSFGGVSGGGLWQVPLRRDGDGSLTPLEPILSGVAFYQSEMKNGIRTLKCHGRKSIYILVHDLVREMCS